MKSSTTAIIVSYKSKWIIENCIKSIEQNARIIVVENSNDYKLKKFLEKKYKNLKVVINNNNNGFGNGANIGALKSKTKYLLFLGPDTVLENKAITNITKIAKSFNNDFGAILPIDVNKKVKTILEVKKSRGATLIFIKKDTFLKVGLFDENLEFWYCDDDYINTLRKFDIKHALVTKSIVKHLGSHTLKLTQNTKEYISLTSKQYLYFDYKWHHNSKFIYNSKRLWFFFKNYL